jgi:hypothetical protein
VDNGWRREPIAAFTRLTVKTSTSALPHHNLGGGGAGLALVSQRFECSWAETAIISDGHESRRLGDSSKLGVER